LIIRRIDLKRDRLLPGSVHVVVARPSPDRERKVRREQIVICREVQCVVHNENDAVCLRPVVLVLEELTHRSEGSLTHRSRWLETEAGPETAQPDAPNVAAVDEREYALVKRSEFLDWSVKF
jgi:hypothetical protein